MPGARRERRRREHTPPQPVVLGVARDVDEERVGLRPREHLRRGQGRARGPHVGVLRRAVVGEAVQREPVAGREIRERTGVHTGAVLRIDVEALGDQRVHEPRRLARATDDPDVELVGEVPAEVAHDDETDALRIGGDARAVHRLPLHTRVREAGVEEAAFAHSRGVGRRRRRRAAHTHAGHRAEHRRATAVLGVDQHRRPSLAVDGAQDLELGRVLVRAREPVEPDHVLVGRDDAVHGSPHPLVAEVAEHAEVLDRGDVDVGDPGIAQDRRC